MQSIWSQTAHLPQFPPLQESIKVDVAVIGAGMAGVLIARALTARGLHTVVLEAAAVGSGQTGNTTGKITAQHALCYHAMIERLGEARARAYAQANQQGVEALRAMVKANGVACDFIDGPAYLYSKTEDVPLRQEALACGTVGLKAAFTQKTTLPFPVKGAVRMEGQAMFHPLKFLAWAVEGLEIYENTPVLRVEGQGVITPQATIEAEHIVFACHYPFLTLPGLYFARMHQQRSYVAAVEGAAQLDGMYYGVQAGGLSLRNWESLLLVGGGGHRTGENSIGGQYAMLETRAAELFAGSKGVARWSAQDCMTLDGVPYIGSYSASRPNWYVATGFGKWGMSTSMVASQLLADAICGVDNPWAAVFSPRRSVAKSAKTLLKEGGHTVKNLTKLSLNRPELEQLPLGHGGIVSWQGEKVGAYRNAQGQVYLVDPKCPHMGCQLSWNPEECSWDCPCHGSRFDYKGIRLANPAQQNL